MANIEEQIKVFLSDKKKAEALASDDAFMEKISGGTATPQDISKKFGEQGLPLSEEEAKIVVDTANAILTKTEVSKLDNDALDTVSGGHWTGAVSGASFIVGAAGTVGSLGCQLAGMVCKNKANKAAMAGDMAKSERYSTVASDLSIASIACVGVGAVGIGMGIGFGIPARKHTYEQGLIDAMACTDQANPSTEYVPGSWKRRNRDK